MSDAGYDHSALRIAALATGPIVLVAAGVAAERVRALVDNDET